MMTSRWAHEKNLCRVCITLLTTVHCTHTLKTQMKTVARQTNATRLRAVLFQRGISAKDVSEGTHLSLSLIEKISAGVRPATSAAITKIENFLGERIWSSPSKFKEHQAERDFQNCVAEIASAEQVGEEQARELAISRFPRLAASFQINN